jgi:hypothetical protein
MKGMSYLLTDLDDFIHGWKEGTKINKDFNEQE